MEFKDRVRYLRTKNNMTTAKLAAEFDKSDTAIRMWESGKSKPDADTLIRLADFFHCSTDYLLGLTHYPNPEQAMVFAERMVELSNELTKMRDSGNSLIGWLEDLIEGMNAVSTGEFLYNDFCSIVLNLGKALEMASAPLSETDARDDIFVAYVEKVLMIEKYHRWVGQSVESCFRRIGRTSEETITSLIDSAEFEGLKRLAKVFDDAAEPF